MSDWTTLMDRVASSDLTGREARVVAFIARQTIGWRKPADRLSAAQIAAATGIHRRDVGKLVEELHERGVINVEGGRQGNAPMISLNLNGSAWHCDKGDQPAAPEPHVQPGQPAVPSPQVPAAPTPHTKGRTQNTPASPAGNNIQRQAFEAYLSHGGNLELDGRRSTLGRQVKTLLAEGIPADTIIAAAADLGRTDEFPGYLKQKVSEIQDAGGPCCNRGLDRSKLDLSGLEACACGGTSGCAAWIEARAGATPAIGTSA